MSERAMTDVVEGARDARDRLRTSRLEEACRDAIERHGDNALRWLPTDRYLSNSSHTVREARTMARHLMRSDSDGAYDAGIRIMEAVGEVDLEVIVPLHREAMETHRGRCLWNVAPSASWAGLARIAGSLREGGMEANRLAERIEKAMERRCP